MEIVAVMIFLSAVLCGGVGAYVSSQKGRGETEGLLFGVLLGPIGVLVAAMLPAPPKPARRRPRPDFREAAGVEPSFDDMRARRDTPAETDPFDEHAAEWASRPMNG